MASDTTGFSEQAARDIVSACLQQEAFRSRLTERCETWDIDFTGFIDQVQHALFIALNAATPHATPRQSPAALATALHYLAEDDTPTLFAALPTPLPEHLAIPVRKLQLMSTNLTAGSSIRWMRITTTATLFLDEALNHPELNAPEH
ncbi:hypothetical protein ACIF70_40535 [Actinacidiphila glaucinigra]|uniref:hypothetical protein n=1 Tax=Actinacidiphila glaucinigra TaxID=235986 RepID=UPI0037C4FD50